MKPIDFALRWPCDPQPRSKLLERVCNGVCKHKKTTLQDESLDKLDPKADEAKDR